MFATLTERLAQTLNTVTGKATLSENNIKDALREVRMALLEADVALPVVRAFIDQVKARAIGQAVQSGLTPSQGFVKTVQNELIDVMGTTHNALNLATQPPAVILMAGLQGAGKTTSVAKLGHWLQDHHKKSVMVASTDVYRPAAINQLEALADTVGLSFFSASTDQSPMTIATTALQAAKIKHADVLIVDTAGRLHIDDAMMTEIKALHQALTPIETLFVVDAMTGQDAANTAKTFNEALPLTGVILTKVDGDARGGAALSVRHITGKPIKFMGVGEKTDALEAFHPDRIASRILGMGDVLSLIEQAERKLDRKKADKFASKLKKGQHFDLTDFRDQLQQMHSMGGIGNMLEKIPGLGASGMTAPIKQHVTDNNPSRQMEAIINAMTPAERTRPDIINGSRKRRVAAGSGTHIQDVNRLLKQYKQVSKMMKKMAKKGGLTKLMRQFGNSSSLLSPGSAPWPF